MQTNILLSEQTTAAIDLRVEKILKDLGHPSPPLCLADVRHLLKLDLGYYSVADTNWLKEKIHQLKVAGKQVLSEPTTIFAVTKSLGLKGVLLVDRRRILLDTDVAKPKLRWNEAHEITHDVLPWHDGLAHGDPESTLSPACHEQLEAEANYGAGRLLFCGSDFKEIVRPRWTVQKRQLIDRQNQQFLRAAKTGEFYFVPSSVRKSVWTFVRQLRGPHLSTCA